MRRFQWLGSDSVAFHIGHGDMIRLLRRCGFGICDLIEVQTSAGLNVQASGRYFGLGPAMALRRNLESAQIILTQGVRGALFGARSAILF